MHPATQMRTYVILGPDGQWHKGTMGQLEIGDTFYMLDPTGAPTDDKFYVCQEVPDCEATTFNPANMTGFLPARLQTEPA